MFFCVLRLHIMRLVSLNDQQCSSHWTTQLSPHNLNGFVFCSRFPIVSTQSIEQSKHKQIFEQRRVNGARIWNSMMIARVISSFDNQTMSEAMDFVFTKCYSLLSLYFRFEANFSLWVTHFGAKWRQVSNILHFFNHNERERKGKERGRERHRREWKSGRLQVLEAQSRPKFR